MLEAGLLASNKFHFWIKLALTFDHTLSGWVQSRVGMPDCTHLCLLHVTPKGRQARWVERKAFSPAGSGGNLPGLFLEIQQPQGSLR